VSNQLPFAADACALYTAILAKSEMPLKAKSIYMNCEKAIQTTVAGPSEAIR
jgi:hypothetical protein